MLKRILLVVHRWLGVALCALFLIWFPSGIGMMYWDFPSVTPKDRLDRSPGLIAATIAVSPDQAYAASGLGRPPTDIRLNSFDGRPAYRFRAARSEVVVYADTGERQADVSKALTARIAAAWTGQPANVARVEAIDEVDQWAVQGPLRTLRPLWKYSWPSGEQVYVSQTTGDVVQYTTTASRFGAYLGPIPHWLYFTRLRKHQAQWSQFVIWSSGLGTFTALIGIVIGLSTFSPTRRYQFAARRASTPYRGQKRWHAALGLIFGVGAVTWAFSGMLSMDPFAARTPPRRSAPALADALRQPPRLADFSARPPREALAPFADRSVKELEFATVAGQPVYIVVLADGGTRVVPMHGLPENAIEASVIADVAIKAASGEGGASVTSLDRYDAYYIDRQGHRPLPVTVVQINDSVHTRYYIDPRTARIVGSYSSSGWTNRWLYHGLHSLDFPWLYRHRPVWDIVVIAFMLGGAALSVTSFVLAWQVVRWRLLLWIHA